MKSYDLPIIPVSPQGIVVLRIVAPEVEHNESIKPDDSPDLMVTRAGLLLLLAAAIALAGAGAIVASLWIFEIL